MSRSRHTPPLSRYSLSPVRYKRRATATSLQGTLSPPSLLKIRLTSAMPSDFREPEPWKITSSIFWPRRIFGLCSPSAQRTASATLDLPQPLGPTIQVTPGNTWSSVFSAKDLKPWIRMLSSRIGASRKALSSDTTGRAGPPKKKPHLWGVGGHRPTKCWRRRGRSSPLQKAALLVLLSRPAGAGIVAAHLLAIRGTRLGAPRRPHGRTPGLTPPAFLPVRRREQSRSRGGGLLLLDRPRLEELLDGGFLQRVDHLLEHLEGFLLVLR